MTRARHGNLFVASFLVPFQLFLVARSASITDTFWSTSRLPLVSLKAFILVVLLSYNQFGNFNMDDEVGFSILMQGHAERLKQWVSMGLVLIIIGIILHFTDGEIPWPSSNLSASNYNEPSGHLCFISPYYIAYFLAAIPINKQLYSFSYVCFTAGAAGLVFSGFYVLV